MQIAVLQLPTEENLFLGVNKVKPHKQVKNTRKAYRPEQRVYWKAPSMVVLSLEFGPEPLPFTPAPPPLPCWNMLVSNHL